MTLVLTFKVEIVMHVRKPIAAFYIQSGYLNEVNKKNIAASYIFASDV